MKLHKAVTAMLIGLAFAAAVASTPPKPAAPPEAVLAKPWLNEVVRHLYRWYIDERDIDPVIEKGEVIFWACGLSPKLDEGDKSLYAEVILPQFSLLAKVKKADYAIPELNETVKSDTFRIVHIEKIDMPPKMPDGYVEVREPYPALRDELFRTRNAAAFPQGELLDRLLTAVRTELADDIANGTHPPVKGAQVLYLAPLSPVANEAWVFWETGRTLIRFASDIDLSNPDVWKHEKLAVHLYHLDQKVVVSLDEVEGSNAFLTRNEAGRAIFNCVVLGEREEVELPPAAPAAK